MIKEQRLVMRVKKDNSKFMIMKSTREVQGIGVSDQLTSDRVLTHGELNMNNM